MYWWYFRQCFYCTGIINDTTLSKIVADWQEQHSATCPVSTYSYWYCYFSKLKGLCHQIRIAWEWYCFKRLGIDMSRLIFKISLSEPLIFNRHLKFLCLGSKSVQFFHFVLNLIWGCSKWVRICSICVLNVARAALFRSWTEVEETIILNLCSKPT